MTLDLAIWEWEDKEEECGVCSDVETDGEWVWGVGGGMFLPLLMGRRCDQSAEFNLCVGDERQPYRAKYLVSPKQTPHVEWNLAVAEGRVGHIFYVDEDLAFLARPQQTTWKVFLRADGLGSWHRLATFLDENNSGDIVQDEPQSFRWHEEKAKEWLQKPGPDWFTAFRVLAEDENSNVAFAEHWAAKERNARYRLSAMTRRDSLEVLLRVLHLAVITDVEVWRKTDLVSCQLQLVDDEPAGERLWVSEFGGKDAKTPRFERLAEAAIRYFEPKRGGKLAELYPCVRQWLEEYNSNLFHKWLEVPTQHKRMEALLELRTLLQERELDWQNLLA